MKVYPFKVAPNFPESLEPLQELARNMWFSWNWEAVRLLIRLDSKLWEESYQNPVDMLTHLPQEEIDEAARDDSFIAHLNRVHEAFQTYMTAKTWFERQHGPAKKPLVAYFSCEYGIDEGLPIYSGGLGILSGDHLKTASDLGIPLVGVGLLYRQGYFRQYLNPDGWQQELYPENDWYHMPVTQERDSDGKPLRISIEIGDSVALAQVWRVQVGRVALYLLDTNFPENSPENRAITTQLYGGDREMRLRQEILLGMGGVRALAALGIEPRVYHINEGHSAFLALERIRQLMQTHGLSYQEAREVVWSSSVFTTHTPVPAGNERFDAALLRRYLSRVAEQVGLSWDDFLALGRENPGDKSEPFCMTVLALRMAAFCNGVSELHGQVSRRMWRDMWPEVPENEIPIKSITNGIHTRSWLSHDMDELFDAYIGPRFVERPDDLSVWERVDSIPDVELWRTHERRRERLVFFVRKRLTEQLRRHGAGSEELAHAQEVLDPHALTVVFARRFATYKRGTLLFNDLDRLYKLVSNPDRPVQFVFAGKAHPQDNPGKEIIKKLIHYARDERFRPHVAFLEDYDINVGRYLVQGADVWLNTPRRPLEASGTSGMKAAANGALNLSVLDGWWCEGYSPERGWAIGSGEEYSDPEEQDHIEGHALFHVLEREVIPLFYERNHVGLPRGWIEKMKASLKVLGAQFSCARMLMEYTETSYLPALAAWHELTEDSFARAKSLAAWCRKVSENWHAVKVIGVEGPEKDAVLKVDTRIEVRVKVALGELSPDDVSVEVFQGSLDSRDEIVDGTGVAATVEGDSTDGVYTFRAELDCESSGRHGYAARVLPRHEDLVHSYVPNLITWE